MARSYGRLFPEIWNDEDFRPLTIGAKLMYGFLISQSDLDHSGIISWRPGRWALDLAEPEADVIAWLKELDQDRYVVIDEERQELLVRSLIRRDEIWKLPNVFKSACGSAKASKSRTIKAALYGEVKRIDFSTTRHETQALAKDLLTVLEPFANPSGTDPEPSRDRSETASQPFSDGSGNYSETVQAKQCVDNSGESRVSAGNDGSRTVPQPSAEPLRRPHGVGVGNGPVVVEAPTPTPTPSPPVLPEPIRSPRLSAVPDVRAEEGGQSIDDTSDITELVVEVRAIRPAWSTRSIERALADPSVTERPWSAVREAMLAVARDPESKHPGRLAHDGPWWPSLAADPYQRPPWCGHCRESTRRIEDENGDDAGACPNCHPRTARFA